MKRIKTRSAEEYKKAFELFVLSGLPIGRGSFTIESFIYEYPYEDNDTVGIIDGRFVTAWRFTHSGVKTITFDDTEEIIPTVAIHSPI